MSSQDTVTTQRQLEILEAARDVFMHYGFRRTTLEDIAGAAGLSRTSVYNHFASKELVFRAVTQRVHEEALADAARCAAHGGPLADVLVAILDAVLGAFIEIVRTARHGHDLVQDSNRICPDVVAATGEAHRALVARVLEDADADGSLALGAAGFDAATAASYLVASAGAFGSLVSAAGEIRDEYRQHLRRLVGVWMRGLSR